MGRPLTHQQPPSFFLPPSSKSDGTEQQHRSKKRKKGNEDGINGERERERSFLPFFLDDGATLSSLPFLLLFYRLGGIFGLYYREKGTGRGIFVKKGRDLNEEWAPSPLARPRTDGACRCFSLSFLPSSSLRQGINSLIAGYFWPSFSFFSGRVLRREKSKVSRAFYFSPRKERRKKGEESRSRFYSSPRSH